MFCSNMHTHTVFSDGANPPEAYVQEAIQQGFVSLGFSEHAPTHFMPDCGVLPEHVPEYFQEIRRLQEKYKDQLEIYLGFENESLCPFQGPGLDFTIGSVHFFQEETTGEYFTIDYTHTHFQDALNRFAKGDIRKLVRTYYETVAHMALTQKPDILGHFDLITKLNKGNRYFDPESSWYLEFAQIAVDAAAKSGCIVEVSTGGMAKEYTENPYPSLSILTRLKAQNVPVTISSDAHQVGYLSLYFQEAMEVIRKAGYTKVMRMQGGRFQEIAI